MSNAPSPSDPSAYFQDLIHAGRQSMKRSNDALALAMGVGPKTSAHKGVFSPFASALDMQRDYVTQLWRFWNAAFIRTITGGTRAAVEPTRGDKRFSDDAWQETPYYVLLKQSYLVTSNNFTNWLIMRKSMIEQGCSCDFTLVSQ